LQALLTHRANTGSLKDACKEESRRAILVPDLSLGVLGMRFCVGRTVKRVKPAGIGDAVVMTVYNVRIVNSRGSQPWRGHDH
jgi:hypothetical protein